MTTFTEADEAYRKAIEAPGRYLLNAFESANSVAEVNLKGKDITQAVLLRLKSFMWCQEQIKNELGKVYSAPAADFFVETICFFLKVALIKLDPTLTVFSEKNIVRRRGSMRPDISIWRGDSLVVAIECKTQLGWNRDGWLSDFEYRENKLSADFPSAKLLLLVMTGCNWGGFGDDIRVAQQFFVLLKEISPNRFEISLQEDLICHPIEILITEILNYRKF
jgi:hypothetical protein